MILISFTLFFSTPSAKAVSLAQIYEAVEKVTNVCISKFQVGHQEPYQKTWISTLLRVKLIKTKKHKILWDLQNWAIKEIDTGNNSFTEIPIQPDTRSKYEDYFGSSLGLLPFSDISTAKKVAEWNRVDNESITSTVQDTEVYDLTWTKKSGNLTMYYKWRVFVDTTTDLPKRIEWYQKIRNDSEYVLQTIDIVAYPTDDEIGAVIQNAFN
jgi:hypothetical protein